MPSGQLNVQMPHSTQRMDSATTTAETIARRFSLSRCRSPTGTALVSQADAGLTVRRGRARPARCQWSSATGASPTSARARAAVADPAGGGTGESQAVPGRASANAIGPEGTPGTLVRFCKGFSFPGVPDRPGSWRRTSRPTRTSGPAPCPTANSACADSPCMSRRATKWFHARPLQSPGRWSWSDGPARAGTRINDRPPMPPWKASASAGEFRVELRQTGRGERPCPGQPEAALLSPRPRQGARVPGARGGPGEYWIKEPAHRRQRCFEIPLR